MLLKFMTEYSDELSIGRAKNKYAELSLGSFVRKDIAGQIRKSVDSDTYLVKGSVGGGRWADVPWVGVFDKRVTTSATKGVYIVYLLNKDTRELYLTLNQGATEAAQSGKVTSDNKTSFIGITSSSNKKTNEMLENRARAIYDKLGKYENAASGIIDTGSKPYDSGSIYYKKYTVNSLPDDDILYQDLNDFIQIYKDYYENIYSVVMPSDYTETVDDSEEMNYKEIISSVKDYIKNNGFTYSDGIIEDLFLCLKTKPFVILAGTSGTGKTKLVRLFSEAIGAKYRLISVRPDWTDSSDLFGYTNLQGEFVPGSIIDFINEASNNLNIPYILCMDEMNLARVEYYLSDYLSIIETRALNGEEITTDCIRINNLPEKYGDLYLPENLFLVGTVNMDETTFPFSKKVLDRANTIEFSDVYLIPDLNDMEIGKTAPLSLTNEFLKSKYLTLVNDVPHEQSEFIKNVCTELEQINQILAKTNSHIGYRVRDEIVFYCLYNNEYSLLEYEDSLDYEIMQKILPRIQGSSSGIRDMLKELFEMFTTGFSPTKNNDNWVEMKGFIDNHGSCKYRKSSEKICYMMRRFEEDGFTSYWL